MVAVAIFCFLGSAFCVFNGVKCADHGDTSGAVLCCVIGCGVALMGIAQLAH